MWDYSNTYGTNNRWGIAIASKIAVLFTGYNSELLKVFGS
jgi:hypothetical protein